jgi:hypothetical protein
MNRHAQLLADRAKLVDRLADDVEHAAQRLAAHGRGDLRTEIERVHAAHHAVGGFMATVRTRPSPRCCCTSRITSMGVGTVKPSLVTRSAW